MTTQQVAFIRCDRCGQLERVQCRQCGMARVAKIEGPMFVKSDLLRRAADAIERLVQLCCGDAQENACVDCHTDRELAAELRAEAGHD